MEINEELRGEIFEIVENQLHDNNPPETKITYNRLIGLGYDGVTAKKLIGQCITVEILNVIKHQEPFNESRYVKNLKQLPKEP